MRYKVLLVEDESDLAKIISDTLSDTGYKVVSAGNGEEGLAKYLIEKPDIVVADVMMPKLDGFGMARKIRDLSSDVPIIFLTAKSGIDDIEEGFGIGANDYLRKPFELRELIVRIKALLMRQDQSHAEFITFRIGKYIFNDENQTLSFGGKEMCLSNIEARLLKPLAANIGKTVLLTLWWPYGAVMRSANAIPFTATYINYADSCVATHPYPLSTNAVSAICLPLNEQSFYPARLGHYLFGRDASVCSITRGKCSLSSECTLRSTSSGVSEADKGVLAWNIMRPSSQRSSTMCTVMPVSFSCAATTASCT